MSLHIKIDGIASLNEIGGRSNNEDFVLPIPEKAGDWNHGIFIVCDGVGGSEKGEIASRLVAETLLDSLSGITDFLSEDDVRNALRSADSEIDAYLQSNPDASGMATTVTLAAIHHQGVTIAHVGDSRVYHVRDGHILFVTTDHSWVNEMVMSGVITIEQAADHPRKNVITRAVQGSGKPARPDVTLLTDIRKGDIIFLCTDGILESVSDHVLAGLCSVGSGPEAIINQIKGICQGNSRDNFTCCLIAIGEVSGGVSEKYLRLPYALEYVTLKAVDENPLVEVISEETPAAEDDTSEKSVAIRPEVGTQNVISGISFRDGGGKSRFFSSRKMPLLIVALLSLMAAGLFWKGDALKSLLSKVTETSSEQSPLPVARDASKPAEPIKVAGPDKSETTGEPAPIEEIKRGTTEDISKKSIHDQAQ